MYSRLQNNGICSSPTTAIYTIIYIYLLRESTKPRHHKANCMVELKNMSMPSILWNIFYKLVKYFQITCIKHVTVDIFKVLFAAHVV